MADAHCDLTVSSAALVFIVYLLFKGHWYLVKPCLFPTQMAQPCLCQPHHHGPLVSLSLSISLRGKEEWKFHSRPTWASSHEVQDTWVHQVAQEQLYS